MSAANARDAAEEWIASSGLPLELRGRVLQLVTFVTDEDCRFFYPRRALKWQQQVNTYISKGLRKRHVKIHRVPITPADYEAWRGARADSGELRRQFADSFQKLLE